MTSWLAWGGLGLIGASTTAWIVTQPDTRSYPVPIGTARERLAAASLPPEVLLFGPGDARLTRTADGLRWSVGAADDPMIVEADLSPDGASTDVRLSITMPRATPPYTGILKSDVGQEIARSALEEHVDAVLGGRAYDPMRAMLTSAQRLQAKPEAMQQFGESLRQDMIAAHDQIERDLNTAHAPPVGPTSDRALRPDPKTTEPMIKLD